MSCSLSCGSQSSSSRSHCGTRCLAAGASGILSLRCVTRLFSALQLPSLSRSRVFSSDELGLCICLLSITACLPRPCPGTLLSPGPFLSFWTGENVCPARDVKSVLVLFDVVHHLLVYGNLLVPVSSCEYVTSPSCWTPTASL